ncbi:hypothetical protein [Streptomyces sp. NPDC058953]|uniref:hypothetical protein n=1 Tax=unclassified Streptomyces TaxID=2593676 RepID=UPI0036C61E93
MSAVFTPRIFAALGSAALGSALFLGTGLAAPALAAPAQQSACTTDSIFTSGAKAYVQECQEGNRVRVKGWVEDTHADGQCAYLRVQINTYVNSWQACPAGTRTPVDTGWHVYPFGAKYWLVEA